MAQMSKIVGIFIAAALLATVITGAVICTNAGNATTEEQSMETVVVNDINGDNAAEEEIAQAWIKVIIPSMIAPYNNNSAWSAPSVEEFAKKDYKVEERNNPGLEVLQSKVLSGNSDREVLYLSAAFDLGNALNTVTEKC